MKKIWKSGLLALLLLVGLTACYDDNGNYDYTELPEIAVATSDTVYATQFKTLNIPVDTKLDRADEADYEYYWRIWSNGLDGTFNQKTICQTKDLSYDVTEMPGSYTLVLTCHNKKTNVDTYKSILLYVQGIITEGWMVLQEKDGKTDFDLIMSPYFSSRVSEDDIIHDVYESVNGEPLEGRGVKIGSFFCLGRYQNVVVLTDKGGARLDATTMQKTYDMSTLMMDMSNWKPENYISYHYYYSPARWGYDVIISNGHFYEYSAIGATGFTTYTEPIQKDGMTYRAAPYTPRYFDYYLSLFYDQDGGRFLCCPKNNYSSTWILQEMPDNASGTVCNVKDMKATMRYMETGFKNHDYGLFVDWNTNENVLYEFNFDNRTGVDVAKYEATNCPEIDKAKYFEMAELGPIMYYATDRNIYLYDYAGTNSASVAYTLANSNEKITGMKLLKPLVNRYITSHPYNNKVLFISTYNETTKEGKVYMYNVNVSNGVIDTSTEKVIGGFGEILDMQYNFAKYGS